jgi:uncharacterized membrane protein YidH (DUF202 family)
VTPLEVSNYSLAINLGFALLLLACYGYVFFRVNRRLRAKGYLGPARPILLILAYAALVAAAFYNDMRDPQSCWDCSPDANPDFFRPELLWVRVRRFALNFTLAATGVLALIAAAARFLPARQLSDEGRLSAALAWRRVGFAALACIPLVAVLALARYVEWLVVFRTAIVASLVFSACERGSRTVND